MSAQQRRWTWTALIGAWLAAALLLKLGAGVWTRWLPGCVLRRLTGWYCPGCGGTRAFLAIMGGDIGRAMRMNPLAVVLGMLGLVVGLRAVWRERCGISPALPALPLWCVWALTAVVLAFALLRNLPQWPFCWLAPG